MKTILAALPATTACLLLCITAMAEEKGIPNPLIDYPGFMKNAGDVGKIREKRRITEEQFIKMAEEPGTIVLDARSALRYAQMHVKGAVNLSLPDATADELEKVLPDKNTRVLIYCNNNFINEPTAFASKAAITSLNIYTFNTLYGYGYHNIYELGPLIDINKTILPLEGSLRKASPHPQSPFSP